MFSTITIPVAQVYGVKGFGHLCKNGLVKVPWHVQPLLLQPSSPESVNDILEGTNICFYVQIRMSTYIYNILEGTNNMYT